MRDLRILHFAHSFIPQYGGTTTRLINLLSDDVDTHYLYVPLPHLPPGPDQFPLPLDEEFNNIKVRRCKFSRKTLPGLPMANVKVTIDAARMAKSVKEDAIDIVHGHNPATFAHAALRSAKARNLPLIYEYHRLPFDSCLMERGATDPSLARRFISHLSRWEERQFLRAADAIIVQTTMHQQRLLDLFALDAARIHVIPMGVDEGTFDPRAWERPAAVLRRERGWSDRIVFMFNGNLEPANGIGLFLDGAAALPATLQRKAKFIVLGRGSQRPLVERMQRDHPDLIEHLGLVEYAQMPLYYRAADVVAIPVPPVLSWQCNNPTKLLEAMAMERIILGSDVRGITELITDGSNGVIFRGGDASDYRAKVSAIIERHGRPADLGPAARVTVVTRRTWKQSRTLLRRVYEALVSAGNAPAERNH